MNKRAVILLLICFVLAAATVTLRYIESEKEKIKAQFVPPPRVEPKRVTNVTTTAYLSQEEPGGEEALPAGEQPGTVPPVEKGTILPEGKQDASEGETPRGIDPRSQRMERGELREPSMPPITEEPAAQEGDSAVDEEVVTPLDEEVVTSLDEEVVTPLDEEVVTPLDEEVPAQPAAGERVPDEETDAEPEEDVADERDEPDDESAKEAGSEDEEDVSPGLESEITSDKDEQIPPEELGEEGEVEEGEYVEGEEEGEPFEEGLEGEEDEMAGEEEGIPLDEEAFPPEEEDVLGEEEVFLDEEE